MSLSATTITESGLALTGTGNGNYTLTPPSFSAAITPKPLTIIGLIANNKTADGHPTATLSGTAALLTAEAASFFGTGGDGKPYTGDTVSLTGTATVTFATSAAGTGIAVSVGGLSLTGPQSSDYRLSALTLSADITAGPTDHYLVSFSGPSYYQGIPFTTT